MSKPCADLPNPDSVCPLQGRLWVVEGGRGVRCRGCMDWEGLLRCTNSQCATAWRRNESAATPTHKPKELWPKWGHRCTACWPQPAVAVMSRSAVAPIAPVHHDARRRHFAPTPTPLAPLERLLMGPFPRGFHVAVVQQHGTLDRAGRQLTVHNYLQATCLEASVSPPPPPIRRVPAPSRSIADLSSPHASPSAQQWPIGRTPPELYWSTFAVYHVWVGRLH